MAFIFGTKGPGEPEVVVGTLENDTIDHLGGSDLVDGGSGYDSLVFTDVASNFTIVTLAGFTRILGSMTANPKYNGQLVTTINVEELRFSGSVISLTPSDNFEIFGSKGNLEVETINGSVGNDSIDHRGGSDVIDGKAGSDVLVFFDVMENYTISTSSGITRITAGVAALPEYAGNEVTVVNVEQIRFLNGTRNLGGSLMPITGTPNEDVLLGGDGNDVIDPVGGSDVIDGGNGNDTVLINDNLVNFEFWSLSGITLMYGEDTDATSEPYRQKIYLLDSVERVQFLDGEKTLTPANSDINVVYGFGNDEVIVGTPNDDIIVDFGGTDQIDGGAGSDQILFFDNFDNFVVTRIVHSLGTRYYVLGKDVDNVDWDAYEGQLFIIDNVETLRFLDRDIRPGDDLDLINPDIFGAETSGDEDVTGTSGNNIIDHLGGSDRIDGGAGTDSLLFWDVSSHFEIITLRGVTHVLGSAEATTPYVNSESVLLGVENLVFTDHTVAVATTLPANVNLVLGHAFGNGSTETLTATAGADLIDHMGGSDNIDGGAGQDTILFFDSIANFTVTRLAGVTHIIGGSGANPYYLNTDTTLLNVERIEFTDGFIDNTITSGTAAADLLASSTLSETFDGGGGVDLLTYSGMRSAYTLAPTATGYNVRRGTAETDVLLNIERLQFANMRVAIDLHEGGSANSTVRMLGAAFGAASIQNEVAVGIGLDYFDSGATMKQVADLIVDFSFFQQMSDRTFVQFVSNNVGFRATPDEINMLVSLLQVGVERSDLLRAAAELDVNAQTINLTGLRQTGVEYVEYDG